MVMTFFPLLRNNIAASIASCSDPPVFPHRAPSLALNLGAHRQYGLPPKVHPIHRPEDITDGNTSMCRRTVWIRDVSNIARLLLQDVHAHAGILGLLETAEIGIFVRPEVVRKRIEAAQIGLQCSSHNLLVCPWLQ